MQHFEHIKSIWQSHTVDVEISADKMLHQAKKEVGSIRTKSVLNIAGMTVSLAIIILLSLFLEINSWLTQLALGIMTITIAVYILILYRHYRLISNTDFTAHPRTFLIKLKRYQVNRLQLYTRLYWFYVLALALGTLLYFFEIAASFDFWVQVGLIAFSITWIVFCSTFFRRAVLQREKEKIGLLIEKFTRISEQF